MNKSINDLLRIKHLSMKSFLQKIFGEFQKVKQKRQFNQLRGAFLTSFLILFCLLGKAQNAQIITGRVTDSSGKTPLLGVTVTANASKKTVVTKDNGEFSIPVTNADKKLTFSYVGMKTITKALDGENNFTIILMPDKYGS
jgi:hypothetical protein